MARSSLNESLRESRRARDRRASLDALSIRAQELAQQGIRDYATTHGLSYGEARARLRAAKDAGRTKATVPGDE